METLAPTGRAGGIADGDMMPVKKNSGMNCKSASQVNKLRGIESRICYPDISGHGPEVSDFV